uniref:Uncharacterized protein n=2 Tax=Ditylum brightwellii TaxID=49249 RepID=A0A7S4STB2_9STRA
MTRNLPIQAFGIIMVAVTLQIGSSIRKEKMSKMSQKKKKSNTLQLRDGIDYIDNALTSAPLYLAKVLDEICVDDLAPVKHTPPKNIFIPESNFEDESIVSLLDSGSPQRVGFRSETQKTLSSIPKKSNQANLPDAIDVEKGVMYQEKVTNIDTSFDSYDTSCVRTNENVFGHTDADSRIKKASLQSSDIQDIEEWLSPTSSHTRGKTRDKKTNSYS